jgi:alpha-tubulin suppressor-like RCC1 family protein
LLVGVLVLTSACSDESAKSSRQRDAGSADASLGDGGPQNSAGGASSGGKSGTIGSGGARADASIGQAGAGGHAIDASVDSSTVTTPDASMQTGADGAMSQDCVASFATAGDHLCVARKDGALWCWGYNNLGGVGDGTALDRPTPVLITKLGSHVASVADGVAYGCAITTDQELWCWGDIGYGKLGTGTPGVPCRADNSLGIPSGQCEPSPVHVAALTKAVIQVSTGFWHTCAVETDHTLWCWGEGTSGVLGVGSFSEADTPAQVTALGSQVAEVRVGSRHTCARKTDGTLWCWGDTTAGALGNGTTTGQPDAGGSEALPIQVKALGKEVAEVTAGEYHTCARKTDGTLWCWGDNTYGELGDGTTVMKSAPVQVTALGSSVVEVAAGRAHTCARKKDGSLWCWGGNQYGQLGDGTTTNRPAPVAAFGADTLRVAAGGYGTCAEKTDGSLWCWGEGNPDGGTSQEACALVVAQPGGGGVTEQLGCRRSPTLIDAVCQAAADFGGPLQITGGTCTSTTGSGTAPPWPASPTSFSATCTPNCGADTCASYCPKLDSSGFPAATGMPCDTGCCASNKAQFSDFGAGTGGPRVGGIGVSPSGRVFYGTSFGSSDMGDLRVGWSDDDGATWVGMQKVPANEEGDYMWVGLTSPDLEQTNPTLEDQIALAMDPQFAFGGSAATAQVYMAYALAAPEPGGPPYFPGSPTRGRIGIGEPSQVQTWEDLPTPTGALAADSSGALWLSGTKVFRRTGRRAWDATCLPDPGGPGAAIALDGAGTWYVARSGSDGNVYVSRRTLDGQWNTEKVAQGSATAIALGAGTVHVAYLRGGNVYYARRVGAAWVESLAVVAHALPANVAGEHVSVTFAYLSVDACGAPHLGVYAENGSDTFDTYYVRWTATGWMSARFSSSCDPQLSGGVALTTSHAFVPSELCGWSVLGIPLK